jgi:SAM-dependent methyltransferase
MNRNNKILYAVNEDGFGLEIGPGHSPVAPKNAGYKVDIVDHLDKEGLIEKFSEIDDSQYKGVDINLDNVEEVDFVWQGESYLELIGKPEFYDWIIASHLIEHTPDLIGFINDCASILKSDGVLSLVIPDKRYCFDRFRPNTGIAKVIDSYYGKDKLHTPGTACEYFMNVVSKGGKIAWGGRHEGDFDLIHTLDEAKNALELSRKSTEYIDFHAWCFTPNSFRLLIQDLYALGLIPFKEVCFFASDGFEFYVTLGRSGSGVDMDRLSMLKKVEAELAFDFINPVKRALFGKLWKLKRFIKRIVKYN